jgi:hypothetical protein
MGQQRSFVGDVVVHGHRIDVEFGAELAHRQRGEAVALDDPAGDVDDPLDAQRGRSR